MAHAKASPSRSHSGLDDRLGQLVASMGLHLPQNERSYVMQLIAHHDYAGALDCLVAAFGQSGRTTFSRAQAEVASLAREAGIQLPRIR